MQARYCPVARRERCHWLRRGLNLIGELLRRGLDLCQRWTMVQRTLPATYRNCIHQLPAAKISGRDKNLRDPAWHPWWSWGWDQAALRNGGRRSIRELVWRTWRRSFHSPGWGRLTEHPDFRLVCVGHHGVPDTTSHISFFQMPDAASHMSGRYVPCGVWAVPMVSDVTPPSVKPVGPILHYKAQYLFHT